MKELRSDEGEFFPSVLLKLLKGFLAKSVVVCLLASKLCHS